MRVVRCCGWNDYRIWFAWLHNGFGSDVASVGERTRLDSVDSINLSLQPFLDHFTINKMLNAVMGGGQNASKR